MIRSKPVYLYEPERKSQKLEALVPWKARGREALTEIKGISGKSVKEFLDSSHPSPSLYSQMTTSVSHLHEMRSIIEKLPYKGSRLRDITPSWGAGKPLG